MNIITEQELSLESVKQIGKQWKEAFEQLTVGAAHEAHAFREFRISLIPFELAQRTPKGFYRVRGKRRKELKFLYKKSNRAT